MDTKIFNISTNLLVSKTRLVLSNLGLNESFLAFEYLTFVITYMIKEERDDMKTYKECYQLLKEKYNIQETTISNGISKVLKMLKSEDLTSKMQFKLNQYSTLNKIRVLKSYLLENLEDYYVYA